jgi:hypothetical protein
MEWSTPILRLSIRIKKVNTEPTLYDLRTPTPKQKLKKVSFGSVVLELSPKTYYTPIFITQKTPVRRRFSI